MIDRAMVALKPKSLVKVTGTREPQMVGKTLVYLHWHRDQGTGRVYGSFRPKYEEDVASLGELHHFWATEVEPLLE